MSGYRQRLVRLSALPLVFIACSLSSATARGHHSFAMYDSAKLVPISGTVKEFQWTNPHALLWINADSDSGTDLWTIELPTSTGNLARMGWSKRSLKPGDDVVVEINPLRDGKHGGSFKKVTIKATGKVLVASANPPDAGVPDGAVVDPYATDKDEDHEQEEARAKARSKSGCACDLATGSLRVTGAGTWLAWITLALLLARRSRPSASCH